VDRPARVGRAWDPADLERVAGAAASVHTDHRAAARADSGRRFARECYAGFVVADDGGTGGRVNGRAEKRVARPAGSGEGEWGVGRTERGGASLSGEMGDGRPTNPDNRSGETSQWCLATLISSPLTTRLAPPPSNSPLPPLASQLCPFITPAQPASTTAPT